MTVRRRPRGTSGRRPLVEAAVELLGADGYRQRLAGEDPVVSTAHRAAVERTLTPAELAVAGQVLGGEVQGCVAAFLAAEVGGSVSDPDEKIEALTLILGRPPRMGG